MLLQLNMHMKEGENEDNEGCEHQMQQLLVAIETPAPHHQHTAPLPS